MAVAVTTVLIEASRAIPALADVETNTRRMDPAAVDAVLKAAMDMRS
jgi:dTDP-4-amino-4,6-dideoxygalactose transaminase